MEDVLANKVKFQNEAIRQVDPNHDYGGAVDFPETQPNDITTSVCSDSQKNIKNELS